MENASKALLMAAAVLIALMIISLGVYLFINFGGSSSRIHDNITQNQLNQFNSQFTVYNGTEVTIYEVVSMVNLAKQNNEQYGFVNGRIGNHNGNDNYISIILYNGNSGTRIENMSTDDINARISSQVEQVNGQLSDLGLTKYYIEVYINGETGKVYLVNCRER